MSRAGVALLTGLAVLATGTVGAQAAQTDGMPGYWFKPVSAGSGWWVAYHGSGLGVVRYEGDNILLKRTHLERCISKTCPYRQ